MHNELSGDDLRIMRERAERLSREKERTSVETVYHVVVVRRGAHLIGLPIDAAEELCSASLSTLPHASESIVGMIQFRGKALCLVDLWPASAAPQHGDEVIAAVVASGTHRIGLLVDEILGSREILASEVDEKSGGDSQLSKAVTKDYVNIVDVNRIFALEKIQMKKPR